MKDIHYNPKRIRPLLILFHGGGGTHGKPDNGNLMPLDQWGDFADVVSVNYPLAFDETKTLEVDEGATFPGILWWAADKISDLIEQYAPTVTAIVGYSFGACLGLHAMLKYQDHPMKINRADCFVGLYGCYNFLERSCFHHEANRRFNLYMTGTEKFPSLALSRRASPLYYDKFPPMYLLHGNADRIVNPSQTIKLHDRASRYLQDTNIHILEGAPHGFNLKDYPELLFRVKSFVTDISASRKN